MKSMISKIGYVWVSDRWRKGVVLAQGGTDLGVRCAPDLEPYIVPLDNFISERVFKLALKDRAYACYSRRWSDRVQRLRRVLTWNAIKVPASRPRQLRLGTLGWARVGRSWQRAVLIRRDGSGVEVRVAPYLRLYRLPLASFLPEDSIEHHLKFLRRFERLRLKLCLRAYGVPYRVVHSQGARRLGDILNQEQRRDDWSKA
jgi:hypothetical protein